MGKKANISILAVFIAAVILSGGQLSFAAYDYAPLQAIPGFEGETGDFPTYVLSIYKFAIWTVGIAALLMVTIGGFMYFTAAGNTSSLEKAKTVITDALLGVILALTAWLLLSTINPDLVDNKLESLSNMKIETMRTTTNP